MKPHRFLLTNLGFIPPAALNTAPDKRGGTAGSTKLRDYTPASEKKPVSEPLIASPTVQTLSAFSGINETDRRWDAPVTLAGYHEWGKIDDKWTNGLLYGNAKDGNKEEFTRFEIERYNHNGGPVILGFRRENGKYMWYVFVKQLNGKYAPAEGVLNRHEDEFARGGIKNTVDVRYEGQGKFIVREYENGYKMYFNAAGELVSQGYNVSLLNMSVDGKQLIFGGKDADNNNVSIIDEDGKYIALGNHIEMYPDALVIEQANKSPGKKVFYLTNWHGKQVELEGCKYFDSIKAYNNEGSYYLLKNERNGYAVVGKGFMRVGGWYQTGRGPPGVEDPPREQIAQRRVNTETS